jgi:hypothetical protein
MLPLTLRTASPPLFQVDFDRLVIEQFSGAVEDLLVERGLDIS